MSKVTDQIELAIKACEREKHRLNRALVAAYGRTYLRCTKCSKKSQIKSVKLNDVQWYDSNTGSPCGGYYRHSHYAWRCPHCNQLTPVPVVGKEIKIPFESFQGIRETVFER